ncbi:MAG TPA: DUF1772 domain-containing protein [Gammaproteobacteria bacterium]|nr:DUF1772 domain-containing protein [Gammaproteobacteria bacterium]
MARNTALFLAALLLALTAGRAVWIWIAENPFDMSGQTYVEFFQQLDKRIALPIAVTGVGGTVLAGVAAVLHRSNRTVLYLLLLAFLLGLVGDLVTLLVNVPINNRLATWDPTALPADYQDYLRRWWEWHHVRLVAMFGAMCSVFVAMLVRK